MATNINKIEGGEAGIDVLSKNPERIDKGDFLGLVGRMRNAKQNLNTSKGKYDQVRKQMRKDGVDLKILDFVTKLMDMPDEDVVTMFHNLEDYMTFKDIQALRQLDLFSDKGEEVESAAEKIAHDGGYRAAHLKADDTEKPDNPYTQGENNHEHWENGYAEGVKAAKAAQTKIDKKPLKAVK